MVGGGQPLLPEILVQPTPVGIITDLAVMPGGDGGGVPCHHAGQPGQRTCLYYQGDEQVVS